MGPSFVTAAKGAPLVLWLICGVSWIAALDLERAKERPCMKMKAAAVDYDWIGSHKTWYYPLMSRLDLYYTALEVAPGKGNNEIQEDEVYYNSCLMFDITPDKAAVIGFGGTRSPYSVYTKTDLNNTVETTPEDCYFVSESGRRGTVVTTLTDNSTYTFDTVCYDDNQMTWSISSVLKELSKKTIQQIHSHAESLGFDRKFFTGLRYKTC